MTKIFLTLFFEEQFSEWDTRTLLPSIYTNSTFSLF